MTGEEVAYQAEQKKLARRIEEEVGYMGYQEINVELVVFSEDTKV
jgi:hypothetical protein